jgi:plasmid stability protein
LSLAVKEKLDSCACRTTKGFEKLMAICCHRLMAHVVVRNLEDDLLEDYREAARVNKRSLEAELREALRRARPLSEARRKEVLARFAAIRAMTPNRPRTRGEVLIRRDRDNG